MTNDEKAWALLNEVRERGEGTDTVFPYESLQDLVEGLLADRDKLRETLDRRERVLRTLRGVVPGTWAYAIDQQSKVFALVNSPDAKS